MPRTANPAPPAVWQIRQAQNLKSDGALEEVLCFVWIDGRMQSIDGKTYRKYFFMRRQRSKRPEKNKAGQKTGGAGAYDGFRREKIAEAQKDSQLDAPKLPAIAKEQLACISLLKGHGSARASFAALPLSAQKTCAGAYLGAKTSGERRMAWMAE